MQRYVSEFLDYVLSPEGKRTLKRVGIVAVIVVAAGLGFWAYVANVQNTASKAFVHGQDLYTQAIGLEDEAKRGDSLENAVDLFRSAIQQPLWTTNKAEAFLYLSDSLYLLGRHEQAITTLLEFEEKYPHNEMIPWVKLKVGLSYESMRKYEEALTQYALLASSYATSPIAPEALLGQARCKELIGDTEGALETYRTIVSRYPTSAQAQLAQARLDYSQ
jgi:TolA-binding protein